MSIMKKLFNRIVIISTALMILSFILFIIHKDKLSIALFATFITIWYHFFMRWIIGNVVGPMLLGVNSNNKWFHQTKIENKFYRILHVKDWKKFLPTYDSTLFNLKTQSLDDIINNMCQAELIHEIMFIFSLVPIAFSIYFGDLYIFVLTSIVAMMFELCFIIVQRYNRERLVKLNIKLKRRRSR